MVPFPINDLPDEVIQHVFSYLSVPNKLNMCLVCKKWLNIMNCKLLLRDIVVKTRAETDNSDDLSVFIHMSRNFLNFKFDSAVINFNYRELFLHLSSTAECISFNNCEIRMDDNVEFGLSFERLKVLEIIQCTMWILYSSLPNLTELYFSGTLSDNELAIFQKSMKNLKVLSLYCPVVYDSKAYKRFYPQGLLYEENPSPYVLSLPAIKSFISERAATLEELNLYFDVTPQGLKEISGIKNLHLRKISLKNCYNCVGGLIDLFKNQPSLKCLDLSGIMALNNDIVNAIHVYLPTIEEVSINSSSFINDTFGCIFQLQKLRKLNIGGNYASESGFSKAVENFTPTHLRYLNVAGIRVQNIDLLIHKCKNLVHLDLSYCGVTDELLHYISENLVLLQDLTLKRTDITDYGLTGVLEAKPNEDVQKIDEANPKSISNLKHLRKLKLNYCKKITEHGIVRAVRFKYLEYLNLIGCTIIHYPYVIRALENENPNIKKIYVEFVLGDSKASVGDEKES